MVTLCVPGRGGGRRRGRGADDRGAMNTMVHRSPWVLARAASLPRTRPSSSTPLLALCALHQPAHHSARDQNSRSIREGAQGASAAPSASSYRIKLVPAERVPWSRGLGRPFAARGIGLSIARATFGDLGFLVAVCSSDRPRLVRTPEAARRLSTVMLQERTEDDWRADFLLMTTANGTSSLVAAHHLRRRCAWPSPWCRHCVERAGVLPRLKATDRAA